MNFDMVNGIYVAKEIADNVHRHVAEMEDKDDMGAPDVDWPYYIQMCNAGACQVITMRDDEKLAGYAVLMLSNNPRHKDRIEAMCDGLFVEKEYRGKWSTAFMSKIAEYMKGLKADLHILISDEKVGRLLAHNGFKETKKLWSLSHE